MSEPFPLVPAKEIMEAMADATERLYGPIGRWWLDVAQIEILWDAMGYPSGEESYKWSCALPVGGKDTFVYLRRLAEGRFAVLALGPLIVPGQAQYTKLTERPTQPLDVRFITQGALGLRRDYRKGHVVEVGDRVAGTMSDSETRLAIVTEVDANGVALKVKLGPNDAPLPAKSMAKMWYPIQNRDEAFDHYFNAEDGRFKHYMNMRGVLYNVQRRLDREAGRATQKKQAPEARQEAKAVLAGAVEPPKLRTPPLGHHSPFSVHSDLGGQAMVIHRRVGEHKPMAERNAATEADLGVKWWNGQFWHIEKQGDPFAK